MSTCDKTERIGAYHDGELPPDEAEALARHIERCPACRDELLRLRALHQALAAACDVPPAAVARLRGAFNLQRDRAVLRWTKALTAVAAVVLLACSALLYRQPPRVPTPAPQTGQWEHVAVGSSEVPAGAGSVAQDADVELAQSILATLGEVRELRP